MMSKLNLFCLPLTVASIVMFKNCAAQQTQANQQFRDEFHQTYPLPAGARVRVKNAYGTVRINNWDHNEVKVDAVKTASTRQILDDAVVSVESHGSDLNIYTKYPEKSNNWQAMVEYTITVPRGIAALDAFVGIQSLYIEGVEGNVTGQAINGELIVSGLRGEANLSNVNGTIEASFERLSKGKGVSLKSVNRGITLSLPADAGAEVSANSLYGDIKNDFGLQVRRGEVHGVALNGTIGGGGTRITLNNEYGAIQILRAQK
jgi:hypothetical protein